MTTVTDLHLFIFRVEVCLISLCCLHSYSVSIIFLMAVISYHGVLNKITWCSCIDRALLDPLFRRHWKELRWSYVAHLILDGLSISKYLVRLLSRLLLTPLIITFWLKHKANIFLLMIRVSSSRNKLSPHLVALLFKRSIQFFVILLFMFLLVGWLDYGNLHYCVVSLAWKPLHLFLCTKRLLWTKLLLLGLGIGIEVY